MDFNLEAKNIYFRLVEEQDAGFICSLRNDDELNNYLSKSTADENAQREWILSYKEREAKAEEYYFIICRKMDGLQIGTVRLYDFQENPKSFCWGSWILNKNKTKYAAVESALLVYQAGFNTLGFEQSHYDVMKGNDKVHSFHLKMGAEEVSEDDTNIYYVFPRSQHEKNKIHYAKFLG